MIHRVVPMALEDLATRGKTLVRPGVLHRVAPVALEGLKTGGLVD